MTTLESALQSLRAPFATGLPRQEATLLRNNAAQDAAGSLTDDWQTQGAVVGRLRPAQKPREGAIAESLQSVATWEWVMEPGSDPAPVYGDRLSIDGRDYGVVGADDQRPGALAWVYGLTDLKT